MHNRSYTRELLAFLHSHPLVVYAIPFYGKRHSDYYTVDVACHLLGIVYHAAYECYTLRLHHIESGEELLYQNMSQEMMQEVLYLRMLEVLYEEIL